MIYFAFGGFWSCPRFPAVVGIKKRGIRFSGKFSGGLLVLLKVVKVLEKKYPRGLLYIIKFTAATGVFMKDVVNIFESLLKQRGYSSLK